MTKKRKSVRAFNFRVPESAYETVLEIALKRNCDLTDVLNECLALALPGLRQELEAWDELERAARLVPLTPRVAALRAQAQQLALDGHPRPVNGRS